MVRGGRVSHAARISKRMLGLGSVCLVAACLHPHVSADRVPAGARPLSYETIPEVSDARWSAVDGPSARLVQSSGEWENLWRNLTRGVRPFPGTPPVDFHEEVVAILSSEAAHEIRITGAWRVGDRLFVEAVEIVPGAGCAVVRTGEMATAAIRVRRWHGIEGRFIERIETRECRSGALRSPASGSHMLAPAVAAERRLFEKAETIEILFAPASLGFEDTFQRTEGESLGRAMK